MGDLSAQLGSGRWGRVSVCQHGGTLAAVRRAPALALPPGRAEDQDQLVMVARCHQLLPYLAVHRLPNRKLRIVSPLLHCSVKNLLEKGVTLSAMQVRWLLRQSVLALCHLHSLGLTHGSLRASSLLLSLQGELKLGDWGLQNLLYPALAISY